MMNLLCFDTCIICVSICLSSVFMETSLQSKCWTASKLVIISFYFSLSKIIWKIIHIVVYIYTSFLFYYWAVFNGMNIPQFVYPVIHWRTFDLVWFQFGAFIFGYQSCSEHPYVSPCEDSCFYFSWVNTYGWNWWDTC